MIINQHNLKLRCCRFIQVLVFMTSVFGLAGASYGADPSPPAHWTWTQSVRDQGYREGITRTGLTETQTLFWRVPAPARDHDATFVLHLAALVPSGLNAHLDVRVNGGAGASLALAPGASTQTLTLPVPAEGLRDGLVRVDLSLAAARGPDRCLDERLGGASFTVLPETALALRIPSAAARTPEDAWALLPHTVEVVLPDAPLEPNAYATVLRLLTALKATRHEVGTTSGGHDSDAVAIRADGAPEIMLSPSDPATVALLSRIEHLLAPLEAAEDGASFRRLGGDTGTRWTDARALWTVAAPLAQAPPGQVPTALVLDISTPADTRDAAHLLHVFLNGALIDSEQLRPKGRTHRVSVALPPGSLGRSNDLRVEFERLDRSASCLGARPSVPVALSNDSRVMFGPAPTPRQFLDLTPRFSRGLVLILPAAFLTHPAENVDYVSDVLTSLAPLPWRVDLVTETPTAELLRRPFIAIADHMPAGTEGAGRLDRGSARVVDASERTLAAIDPTSSAALAELVSFEGTPGLWLRVPTPPQREPDRPVVLEHGDVAIIDAERIDFFLTSTASRAPSIRYALTNAPVEFMQRYWRWILGGLWVALTALTAAGLLRRRA